MNPYAFALALGAAGLTTMAVLGLSSHAHPGQGHDGHAGHGHDGPGHGAHHDHGDGGHGHHEPAALRLAAIVSPRLWFTLLAG